MWGPREVPPGQILATLLPESILVNLPLGQFIRIMREELTLTSICINTSLLPQVGVQGGHILEFSAVQDLL